MGKIVNLVQIGALSLCMTIGAINVFAAKNLPGSVNVETENVLIKGNVIDDTGETIIGATVVIKGTTTGTTTGVEGDFFFNAPVGATIDIAFLGYKTVSFTVVKGQEVYNFTMKSDAISANEVVVTALGIKRDEKALGYAVTNIDGADIASVNTVSATTALQGKAPGLSIKQSGGGVMSSSSVQIRGVSTLSGNSQPIFVIDGVILSNPSTAADQWGEETNDYGNAIKNLNPDDFESMTVLKGAAATALYGSRGINGAIVITTKSGKAGSGFGVSFSQVTGVDVVYRTPDFQTEYGQGEVPGTITYANQLDGSTNKWDTRYPYFENRNGQWIPSLRNQSGAAWGPRMSDMQSLGYDKVIDYDGIIADYKLYEDNMKDAYELGVNTSTNMTISGGGDRTTFYLSNTYQYRKGNFKGNTFERNSTLLKGSYKISDKINVDASISYNTSKGKNAPFDIGRQFWYGDYNRHYNIDKYKNLWETDHGGAPNSAYGDKYGDVPGMDFFWKQNTREHTRSENMITPIIRLNYTITDWLSFNSEANMNVYNIKTDRRNVGSGYRMDSDDASYELGFEENIQRSAKAAFNFNKRFGNFGTTLITGGEWFRTRDVYSNTWTNGGLIVPGQFFLANSKNPVGVGGGLRNFKNIYSTYFLASFDYKNQLFLDITGRNDWSTALVYSNGKGNNSYFYPSVSGSWIFSDTFNLPQWVTFGKLRASWAQVGNDTNPYFINNTYSIGSSEYNNGMGYINEFSKRIVDPSLRPERKNSMEFGLDARVLDGRIGFDITYYKENTTDQIVELAMPKETGVDYKLINAGNIQNQGWEIAFSATPIKKQNFTWDMNVIYTRNRNKIIELHPDMGDYKSLFDNQGEGGVIVAAFEGGAYGEVLTNRHAKKDANGNNILEWNDTYRGASYVRDMGEPQRIGNVNPRFEGSIFNNLKFHRFNIGILIDGRFGGFVQSISSRYATQAGLTPASLRYRGVENGGTQFTSNYADSKNLTFDDGVIPEGNFAQGTNVTTPTGGSQDVGGMTYKDAMKAGYIEPTRAGYWHTRSNSWGSSVINNDWVQDNLKYVALRNISIGYTFADKITKKLRLSNLHLSLDGQNLGYIYNNMPNNINPESVNGSDITSTREKTYLPYTATYSLGIRFNM